MMSNAHTSSARPGLHANVNMRVGMTEDISILLVEDDPMLLSTLSYNLTNAVSRGIKAADGKGALDAVERERNRPGLVILDIVLPGLNGFQVLRHTWLRGKLHDAGRANEVIKTVSGPGYRYGVPGDLATGGSSASLTILGVSAGRPA